MADHANSVVQAQEMIRFVIAVALAAAITPAAGATECHLTSRAAIGCGTPKNAALAYRRFGASKRTIDPDYIQAILHDAGCLRVADLGDPASFIFLAGPQMLRVATDTGWIYVTPVIVRKGGIEQEVTDFWMAADYLAGDCAGAYPPIEP